MADLKRMLDITIDYVKQRTAFGKPISKFQNTKFKIVEMAIKIKIGETFVNRLVVDHVEGKDIVTEVSMARWWLTDLAQQVAVDCTQLHGGYGYMEQYDT